MNLRRGLRWFHKRLVALAEAGALRVRDGKRLVPCLDQADLDAWLVGAPLPSRLEQRASGRERLTALGGDVA
ncbi:MAG: hypothetical protein ACSLFP_10450 [Acidimicrobiales bacterium]